MITHEMGFYGTDVLYCALLLLLALRAVEQPDRTRVGLLGLVLGLAFWQTSQIVPVAVPAIVWVVWKQPRTLRLAWLAALLAAVGALPWLVWNGTHAWGSFDQSFGAGGSYGWRLRLFFSPVLPMMLGLRTPVSQQPLVAPTAAADVAYAAVLVLFVIAAYRARHHASSLLYLVAAVYPFVYALAAETSNSIDPLYLVVLTPVLVLLIAQVLTSWLRGAVALALACLVSVVTIHRMELLPTKALASGSSPTAPRSLAPLTATLDRLGISRVYAPYLLAYVLDFDTRERIVAVEAKFDQAAFDGSRVVLPDNPWVRQPEYLRTVLAGPSGIVLFRANAVATAPIMPALLRHGYTRIVVGPFLVFAPPGSSAPAG